MKPRRLLLLLTLLGLFSCQLSPEQVPVPGETAFTLRVAVPGLTLTRSPISGTEGIHSMQLLCFDENRLFIGLGSVSLHPADGSGSLTGTMTGTVPASTASIHFIANAGLVPQESWRNRSDHEIVGRLESSLANTHIVYWGYHQAADAATLQAWLTQAPPQTVELLRDRAKVTLSEPDPTWNHHANPAFTENILSARFTLCNGRTTGMTAAYDRSTLSFSYDAPIFLPSASSRFAGTASEMVSSGGAQFLFEDDNPPLDPVKVILEVTYRFDEGGGMQQRVKYHQVMLMQSDHSLYTVRRNHQYNLIIRNLPSSIGYDTFEEALSGSPSNNQTIFVQEIIPQITSGEYSIHILGGTNHIFHKSAESTQYAVIPFTFLHEGIGDSSAGASDFSAQWLSNKYVAYPNAELEILPGAEAGAFELRVELYRPITDDLKSGKILLTDNRFGLSRIVSIYSITAFDFAASLTPTGEADNPYRLSFHIPDNYPEGLFPFFVRLATEDLKPTAAQNAIKALGVVVEETGPLLGVDWDYWYTFEVTAAGEYQILLAPVAGHTGSLTAFLQADGFGTLSPEGEMASPYVQLSVSP